VDVSQRGTAQAANNTTNASKRHQEGIRDSSGVRSRRSAVHMEEVGTMAVDTANGRQIVAKRQKTAFITGASSGIGKAAANYFGVVRVTNAVLPIMRAQRSGRILNVGSALGLIPAHYTAHYAATKHALEFLESAQLPTFKENHQ
jgi:short subunit dehydrogenase